MGILKKLKLVCKILFYVVFVAVFLLVVSMVISKASNRIFFFANRATIWVMTDSMEDQIPANSYIQIRKIDAAEIKEGDVITFYSDDPMLKGQLNTHRVVEISDDGGSFTTKGDHNPGKDKYPVKAESVVGVYEKNLVVLSVIGRVVQTKVGLLCILVFMTVLITFTYAGDSFKKLFKPNNSASTPDEKN